MGPARLRFALRSRRRRSATLLAVLVIVATLAAHHAAPMGTMQHETGLGPVLELCLGVATAVATVVAVAVLAVGVLRWPRFVAIAPAGLRATVELVRPRARPGPSAPRVLRC